MYSRIVRLFFVFILLLSSNFLHAQTTIFNDNCNTMGNWTNTGRIYPANQPGYNWLSVDPTVPADDHTGGGNCLYVNGNNNYVVAGAGNYILYQIVSAPVNLTGWNNTRLEFWMQMRSETGNWDGGFVDWSHDGVNWTQLTTELCVPYDGNMSQNASSTPFYPYLKPAWFNPRTNWTRVLANTSAIDNVPQFYLRFTFHSDEEAMDRGWAIDDIKIVSVAMIQLQGNSIVIPGNNVPALANNTDFGACPVGQFIDKEFFIHNTGESPLTLTGNPAVTVTGAGFSVIAQPAVNVINPGQSVPFTVRFQPNAMGTVNGTITIAHSDIYSSCIVANPMVYNIRGVAQNTPPQISGLQDISVCPGAGPIQIPFTVSDAEQNPNVITCTAVSSDQAILPNGNITITGVGPNRELNVTGLPAQAGTVVVTVTANDMTNVNNTSTATVNVIFEDLIAPQALCQNVQIQLDAAGNGTLTPAQVDNGSTDNCLLDVLTISQSQFSCADVGTLNLLFTATDAQGNAAQCPFTATVLPPAGSLTLTAPEFVGGKEISCQGLSDGTINAIAQGGCAPYSYQWTEIPGLAANQASGLAAGTYNVQATDAAGQVWNAQITLEEPTALVDNSTFANISCFGKTDGRVSLSMSGGTEPYTYSAGPLVSGLPAGNFAYSATDANGCSLNFSFTLSEPAELLLTAPPFVSVQCGEKIPLYSQTLNGTGNLTYNWSGPGVNCVNCAISTAIASESATYLVSVTDENGCTALAQTLAEVSCNVYVPNAFTPDNGDMLNPVFLVFAGALETFQFTVYDRWGQLIYQTANALDGWNGKIRGKNAPQGVYVYKLVYRFPGGKEQEMQGSITLLSGN